MNILPKKSWHVRTKRNIERVRRDEAKAAEEEKERERRVQLAEQEARTDLLRKKANLRDGNSTSSPEVSGKELVSVTELPKGHVNFFEDLEIGKKLWGHNIEREEEKKSEQIQLEKKIGLLVYLGQSSTEAQDQKPWYSSSLNRKKNVEENKDIREEAARKSKSYLDPLRDMKRYLDEKEKTDPSCKDSKRSKNEVVASYRIHKPKKHKHKHKHKKHSSKERSRSSFSSKKSIEELRLERLAREKSERQRAEKLLAKVNGDQKDDSPIVNLIDGHQRYNSQFNPHLARNTNPK